MQLEEWVAGDQVDPSVPSHVARCAHCTGFVQVLEAKQEAFRKSHPPDLFVRQVRARAQAMTRRPWLAWLSLATAVGVAGVVAIQILPRNDDLGFTLKGRAFSAVYLRPGMTEAWPIPDDLKMRKGDAVRFFFQAPGDGYLAILDLDGRGEVSVLYPYRGERMAPIQKEQVGPLPHSIVLDDAPGPELFVAVFASSPLEVQPLLRALHEQARQSSVSLRCEGCRVQVLRVQKEP
jgi:hypothetical protein